MTCWQYLIEWTKIGIGLIFAILAYMLTRRQVNIQADKNKHDKFEKRMKVYEAYKSIVWAVVSFQPLKPEEREAFLKEFWTAKFLFGDDINSFLEEVRKKAGEFYMWEDMIKRSPVENIADLTKSQPKRDHYMKEQKQIHDWFKTLSENHQEKFLPYMKFDKP